MNSNVVVTRDMVIDLLPMYAAGEVSGDSRRAVEQFLEQDAELRRLAENLKRLRLPAAAEGEEWRALDRTRHRIRNRSWIQALAIFFTMLPLSCAGSFEKGLTWLMLRDSPVLALGSLIVGSTFWILLWRRRV